MASMEGKHGRSAQIPAPWDYSFCSAWTFYGRSYRLVSPERAVEDLRSIREPGVFIVDDVAFLQERHGMAIGEAIARSGIEKQYYLETRGDVLSSHRRQTPAACIAARGLRTTN